MLKRIAKEIIKNELPTRTSSTLGYKQVVGYAGGKEIKVWEIKIDGMNYEIRTYDDKRLTLGYIDKNYSFVRENFFDTEFIKEKAEQFTADRKITFKGTQYK